MASTKKIALVSCASVAAVGVLMVGGCVALVASAADDAPELTTEDTTAVAVGLVWGQMTEEDQAVICEGVSADADQAAADFLAAMEQDGLDADVVAEFLAEECG